MKYKTSENPFNDLIFVQSRNIYDYSSIMPSLAEDFGNAFYHTCLTWCQIIPDTSHNLLWQIWLIKKNNKFIGICGLYTLSGAKNTSELWLGWLGIIPELRNKGLGVYVMQHLYKYAKSVKCKKLFSYVDSVGKPLSFYEREGFEVIGRVNMYCKENKKDIKEFEDPYDWVIMKNL